MLLSADTLEILEDLARCGIAVHQFTQVLCSIKLLLIKSDHLLSNASESRVQERPTLLQRAAVGARAAKQVCRNGRGAKGKQSTSRSFHFHFLRRAAVSRVCIRLHKAQSHSNR
jgi:hypothetical protein